MSMELLRDFSQMDSQALQEPTATLLVQLADRHAHIPGRTPSWVRARRSSPPRSRDQSEADESLGCTHLRGCNDCFALDLFVIERRADCACRRCIGRDF